MERYGRKRSMASQKLYGMTPPIELFGLQQLMWGEVKFTGSIVPSGIGEAFLDISL